MFIEFLFVVSPSNIIYFRQKKGHWNEEKSADASSTSLHVIIYIGQWFCH